MKKINALIIVLVAIFSLFGCKCNREDTRVFGVWWWDDTLGENYLEFAKENGVNEIYYCSDNFDENTNYFIKEANNGGIKVYYLAGEYKWLTNPINLYSKIDKYIEYQKSYDNKFEGIHLDIEPHQDPNFDINRYDLIYNLISLANNLNDKYKDITFDYDLPFWLEDRIVFDGENKETYKHMIDIASRVFLMSYRDNAENIYEVSKEEIEYAKSINKKMVIGIETKSSEGDKVSFQEEGKKYMNQELDKLKDMLPNDFGVTIHQIKTWYELKES